ncbi:MULTISPECIES: LysE family translocator [Acinetobacter]|uniref:LysE family translocator n=1 Tax=Acinetobacter TaxID=469 RepID=UPI00051B6D02|nr:MULTISPECIES: LysE family transporter [Acinetobacter]MCH7293889.1 LysE family transporter [Acinetobacter higginsii]MCH7378644.1 LysE family transporter [Acinetobacter higginsii]MCI3878187.1 LysE family transporter [Acinetobacter higginsii]MCJ0827026.1 LysE family transporter [Acinetobacter sp. NIPH1876]MDO3663688.1 LysE family transporter [Acinetobacter higginsii]
MVSFLFIGLIITILLTPGPTNTLLASSGIQTGIKASLKLIPAEVIGYFIAITTWGFLLESVSHVVPWLPPLIKLLSATFIIYLAIKLWITSTKQFDLDQPLITSKALFVATLLNPKALLFASAIFPHTAWLNLHEYVVHMGTFLALITPIAFLWIAFGSILISNKISWLNQRNLQRSAAFVLTFFAMPLAYSAISSF